MLHIPLGIINSLGITVCMQSYGTLCFATWCVLSYTTGLSFVTWSCYLIMLLVCSPTGLSPSLYLGHVTWSVCSRIRGSLLLLDHVTCSCYFCAALRYLIMLLGHVKHGPFISSWDHHGGRSANMSAVWAWNHAARTWLHAEIQNLGATKCRRVRVLLAHSLPPRGLAESLWPSATQHCPGGLGRWRAWGCNAWATTQLYELVITITITVAVMQAPIPMWVENDL